ncbi:MAG: hypothetical protein JNN15_12890, partial [Blastocatellia bacterium]|nr:hypothetical protein [Blastocatellia bacterium]
MTSTEKAAFIEDLFCSSCEFAANRRDKKCPKGQSTCGSKIDTIYTLKRDYVGLTE